MAITAAAAAGPAAIAIAQMTVARNGAKYFRVYRIDGSFDDLQWVLFVRMAIASARFCTADAHQSDLPAAGLQYRPAGFPPAGLY
jgi:hypothetical protein